MKTYYELTRILSSGAIDEEYKYFAEYARRFPLNKPQERYGILKMGTEPSFENFIYDADIKNLRLKHLNHIAATGMNTGHKVRIFIDWLEKMEGKK